MRGTSYQLFVPNLFKIMIEQQKTVVYSQMVNHIWGTCTLEAFIKLGQARIHISHVRVTKTD